MKKRRLMNEIGGIDDRYITEAFGRKRKKNLLLKFTAFAACFAILIGALGLWLFMPTDTERDIYAYRDSEYYPVIKAFHAYNTKDAYGNKFEEIADGVGNLGADILDGALGGANEDNSAGFDGMENAGNNATNGTGSSYEEVTDNQVEGVIEADIIKRTNTHAFYLSATTLSAYSISGEESRCVDTLVIDDDGYYNGRSTEMFLSLDCKRITVLIQRTATINSGVCTEIISIDVSDPADMREVNKVKISGSYITSRLQGETLLFINEFAPQKSKIDFSKPETFLPTVDTGDGPVPIAPDDVVLPEYMNSTRYTVVTKLCENGLELQGSAALLSYTENVYVSEESVYATNVGGEVYEINGKKCRENVSDITRIKYGEDFEICGTARVKGHTKDQYSFDEYNGILRVATTTYSYFESSNDYDAKIASSLGFNASLYLIDIESMKTVASVENFAPKGEQVRSARFDGNMAYICTSVVFTDPVFFFNLSDIENITYTDTGTIEGYSSSLINFGDGYLLGIGAADWTTVKIEVYEESGNSVRSVAKKEYENARYSEVYKSYLVDREAGLLGFGVIRYDYNSRNHTTDYILLYFDGYRLNEISVTNLYAMNGYGVLDTIRAFIVEDYLYIFSRDVFEVVKIS